MKKYKNFILLFIFVVFLGGAVLGYKYLIGNYQSNDSDYIKLKDRKELATNIKVYDRDNNIVNLLDYKGKPIVVNFWATWCGYCIEEMPYFQEATNEYKDNVEILMVNITDGNRETKEKAQRFLSDNNLELNELYDLDLDAMSKYSLYSLPMTLFIDKEGKIQYEHKGMINKELLHQKIKEIL